MISLKYGTAGGATSAKVWFLTGTVATIIVASRVFIDGSILIPVGTETALCFHNNLV